MKLFTDGLGIHDIDITRGATTDWQVPFHSHIIKDEFDDGNPTLCGREACYWY